MPMFVLIDEPPFFTASRHTSHLSMVAQSIARRSSRKVFFDFKRCTHTRSPEANCTISWSLESPFFFQWLTLYLFWLRPFLDIHRLTKFRRRRKKHLFMIRSNNLLRCKLNFVVQTGCFWFWLVSFFPTSDNFVSMCHFALGTLIHIMALGKSHLST